MSSGYVLYCTYYTRLLQWANKAETSSGYILYVLHQIIALSNKQINEKQAVHIWYFYQIIE